MPAHKMTHTGTVRNGRADARCKAWRVELRETGNFWVTKEGQKYRKSSGSAPDDTWGAMGSLDLSTVQPKES